MKLRNKKTGEVIDTVEDYFYMTFSDSVRPQDGFTSIKNFNEIWEDYSNPAEPLIKDEEIRKLVRAWAETNDITQLSYDAYWNAFRCADFVIAFNYDFDRHDGLKDGISYTIAELCGEEEE